MGTKKKTEFLRYEIRVMKFTQDPGGAVIKQIVRIAVNEVGEFIEEVE